MSRLHFADIDTLDSLGILHNLVSLHVQIKKDEVFKMDSTWENGPRAGGQTIQRYPPDSYCRKFQTCRFLLVQGRGIAHMEQSTNSDAG